MGAIHITKITDFIKLEGQCLGESDCFLITQEQITNFANATQDNQWIHINEQRASLESPTKGTIAHGYFVLSLIPRLLNDIYVVDNLDRIVNMRIDKLAFKNVVPVNSRIKLVAKLLSVIDCVSICQVALECRIEIEGQEEPALEGKFIFAYYFK